MILKKVIPVEVIKWLRAEGLSWKAVARYVNSIHETNWSVRTLEGALNKPRKAMFPIGAALEYKLAKFNNRQIARLIKRDYGRDYTHSAVAQQLCRWNKDLLHVNQAQAAE